MCVAGEGREKKKQQNGNFECTHLFSRSRINSIRRAENRERKQRNLKSKREREREICSNFKFAFQMMTIIIKDRERERTKFGL